MDPAHTRPAAIPPAALWLGAAGAIPFVGLASAAPLLQGSQLDLAATALAGYGAVILSFLGGVHWGLAIAGFGAGPSLPRLTVSVIPSLVAWAALLMPTTIGLVVLAGAFGLMLLVDLRASRGALMPGWYPRLRWPLSIAAAASLLLGAVT